jgi:hypothetical protein
MNRRDWLKAAFSFGAIAVVIGASTTAVAARDADLPAEGATETKGGGYGHGGGWGGPPGRARGWGGGNSRWAATRGRKRGWHKRGWRG